MKSTGENEALIPKNENDLTVFFYIGLGHFQNFRFDLLSFKNKPARLSRLLCDCRIPRG